MGHNHDHGHTHAHGALCGHNHAEQKVPAQKNYKLYMKVGHWGSLAALLGAVIMYFAGTHLSANDWIHYLTDNLYAYVLAYFAHKCSEDLLSEKQFDHYTSWINSWMLLLGTVIMAGEILFKEHSRGNPLATSLMGVVLFMCSHFQHKLLHTAHGHEDHGPTGLSGFKTTDQHAKIDRLIGLVVIFVPGWIHFELPWYEKVDVWSSWSIVVYLSGTVSVNLWHQFHGRHPVHAH